MNTYTIPAGAMPYVVTYLTECGYTAMTKDGGLQTDANQWMVCLIVRRWQWQK